MQNCRLWNADIHKKTHYSWSKDFVTFFHINIYALLINGTVYSKEYFLLKRDQFLSSFQDLQRYHHALRLSSCGYLSCSHFPLFSLVLVQKSRSAVYILKYSISYRSSCSGVFLRIGFQKRNSTTRVFLGILLNFSELFFLFKIKRTCYKYSYFLQVH